MPADAPTPDDDPFAGTRSASRPPSTLVQSSLHPNAAPSTANWPTRSEIDGVPIHTLEGTPDPELLADATLPPGFEIERELGRGGMGVVYLARQTALNRRVAVKMLLAGEYATHGQTARFVGEAEAIARIRHPNVVQVFEIGRHHGRAYFSLEFCTGGTLSQKLAGTPLAPREAAAIVAGVAAGVQAAHDAGVIHRDLKPQNVLLQPDGTAVPSGGSGSPPRLAGLIPKVTDFGLAKQADGENLTATGAVMGTPSYMAPEQARGDTQAIGPCTDVYALGTVLYECLTGRPPFRAASQMETMDQVIRDETVPPRRLVPGVPVDLETVCLKCLRKEPGERYASAAALADDLSRWLAELPVTARPLPAVVRGARWVRRNKVLTGLLASLFGLIGAVAAGGWVYGELEKSKAAALGRENAELVHQREVRDQFFGAVADARRLRATAPAEAGQAYTRALAVARAEPAAVAAEEAAIAEAERAAVEADLRRAAAVEADRAAARRRRAEFLTLRDEALFRALTDKAAGPGPGDRPAVETAAAALRLFGLDTDPPDPVAVARLTTDYAGDERTELENGVAELLRLLADERPTAVRLPGAAVAGVAAAVTSNRPIDLFDRCGRAYRSGDMAGTVAAAELLLAARPDHLWGLYLLAAARLRQERYELAAAGFAACLVKQPRFHVARAQRGFARYMAGDRLTAEDDCTAVLTAGDASPYDRFLALNNRGLIRALRQQWGPAEDDLSAASALRPDLFYPLRGLAQVRLGRGDPAAALATVTDALKRFPDQPLLHRDAANVHLARGDRPAARAAFERAADLDPAHAAADHVQLAKIARDDGDPARGLTHADRAVTLAPRSADAYRLRGELRLALDQAGAADADLGTLAVLVGPAGLDARDHRVRGLVRERLRQFPAAVESYSQVVTGGTPDERRAARLSRGRVYLLSNAWELARADFDAVLTARPTAGEKRDAHVGRAEAWARLGKAKESRDDLDRVDGTEPRTRYMVARVYALLYPRKNGPDLDAFKQAVANLEKAVTATPPGERRTFWTNMVAKDPAFAPLMDTPAVQALAARLARLD